MKMIKTVIFDFDGTIANTLPYTFRNLFELLKEEKVNINEQKMIKDVRSKNFQELMKEWKISWVRLPFILGKIKQIQKDLFNEIEKIKFFPGIKKLLVELKRKNYILAILSSNLDNNIIKFLKLNNLDYFDYIHCGSEILGKSVAISNFIKENGWKKEESIYVGDELRDLEACQKSGVKMIGVSWGLNTTEILKKRGADFIASKPSKILKIINKN
ncbi:carotenoid oxygenase [Candidatus Roizmanbacteria bacterium CG11_big_fil_rev_8_21_14_0_20_35_14]|uniref:Carotenoid oxygenase n=3 Tax=Candidatus Roizmaniibacteriota TaxID=1752723 RepID=A0A2M8EZH0_9BACT|nr:MAG: carotenoid oxygenase [Candidatus Roizmanbacteria bacterium CG11_big_fil_rev_8_21_14_0_20_35_14]PJC32400.1 MAG: carotenoid oxygenase [Candidatus Roizmanbacteria bacterium CG_4_9_14_0_2_um_filter_36_12]